MSAVAAANFPIVGKPHPFSTDAVYCEIPVGQTLGQALGDNIKRAVRVEVGGREVPRQLWPHVKPKAGVPVYITAYPEGSSGKKILRAVLMIVVAVVAFYAAPYLAGAMGFTAGTAAYGLAVSGITAAITMVGGMVVNALVPPPVPRMPRDSGSDPTDRMNTLTGTNNRANHGGAIPCIIGEHVFFPTHAALPYTEILGNDQYLYMLLDLGPGDLVVSDIKIGQTPIESYDEVLYEITKTPSFFTQDIYELSVGVDMSDQGDSATRTTQAGTEEIAVDLICPQGLFGVDDKNNTIAVSTNFTIEYRPVGSVGWTNVDHHIVNTPSDVRYHNVRFMGRGVPLQTRSGSRDPIRVGLAWKVPKGQYEVRITRGSTNWGASNEKARISTCQWSVMRSINKINPSKTGTTKLAMRLLATDKLNGPVSTVSVRVAQKIPVWDDVAEVWTAPQTSTNPGYIYRWLLRDCPAVRKRVPAHRIDDEFIVAFAQQCKDKGFEVRGVADSVSTFQEMLQSVLSAGRGTLGWRDGRYSVVWDRPQSVARQVFSPLNSFGFQSTKMFTDRPEAFVVKFVNQAHDWQEDAIIVPFDGFAYDDGTGPKDAHGNAAPNLPLATKFETLQFRFVTTPLHAWKLARFHQGQGTYRPTTYTWGCDIEFLSVTRGDLVEVGNDVTEWGSGHARVNTQVLDGLGNVTELTLDDELEFGTGAYYARVRKNNGEQVVVPISSNGASLTDTILIQGELKGVNKGDLVIVGGSARVTEPLVITGIRPEGRMRAMLSGVKYAPEVYNMDLNPPSSFISSITGMPIIEPPPEPQLDLVYSTNNILPPGDDDGGRRPGVGVTINPNPPRTGGGGGGYAPFLRNDFGTRLRQF